MLDRFSRLPVFLVQGAAVSYGSRHAPATGGGPQEMTVAEFKKQWARHRGKESSASQE